jgi:7,8-dihydropterin-6-yl-methyl-4-(beta-D-ribofuranosyl)aminobenzene 5'-phosphate synthase
MHKMRHSLFKKIIAILFILLPATALGGKMKNVVPVITLTVIYNNISFDNRLTTAWGFSCLVEGTEQTILFDTGGDARILLSNMGLMGIDPTSVNAVFLSHIHGDHTGGLEGVLRQNPHITVYVPESFPISFQQAVASYGAEAQAVGKPIRLFGSVYSSGEMGQSIKEQALIVQTSGGLVIITGCAHPGIVNIVGEVKARFKNDIHLVIGGFHLGGMTGLQIREIITAFKRLGVKKVAPSHCTGERAMVLFQQAWGEDFLEGGAGAVIKVPR